MGSLRMPEHLRSWLSSQEFGRLLRGDPAENAKEVRRAIESSMPPKVVVVGDFSLRVLLEGGVLPDLGIFDRRTKRIPSDSPFSETATVRNPAGEITDEAMSTIRRALLTKRKGKVMLAVDGEEDLLALPAITYAPVGSLVIYGMPDRGMVLVTTDGPTKKKIQYVISQFQRKG